MNEKDLVSRLLAATIAATNQQTPTRGRDVVVALGIELVLACGAERNGIAVANSLTPSAAVRVQINTIETNVLVFAPKRFSK